MSPAVVAMRSPVVMSMRAVSKNYEAAELIDMQVAAVMGAWKWTSRR